MVVPQNYFRIFTSYFFCVRVCVGGVNYLRYLVYTYVWIFTSDLFGFLAQNYFWGGAEGCRFTSDIFCIYKYVVYVLDFHLSVVILLHIFFWKDFYFRVVSALPRNYFRILFTAFKQKPGSMIWCQIISNDEFIVMRVDALPLQKKNVFFFKGHTYYLVHL